MVNIELLAEIIASGMYIFDYFYKSILWNYSLKNPNKIHSSYNILWNDGEFYKISQRKHLQLKQFVYAETKNSGLRLGVSRCNRSVDQLGLEPRTSRLWVCCSNQLSYKSDAKCYGMTRIVPLLRLQMYKYFLNCAIFVRKNMRVDGLTSSWVDE